MPTGEVTVIRKGKECDVEWKMDFASFSKEDNTIYYSSYFSFYGETWGLIMWTNGRCTKSTGYISIRLLKWISNNPPINIEFTFALKAVNGKKYFKRKYAECFDGCTYDIDQFLSKSDFEKRQSEFLASGFLTVGCTLKILNSTGSASDILKAVCSHCEKTFDADEILLHEKKCRIKCPDCSNFVFYKNWHDHDCQVSRGESSTSGSSVVSAKSKTLHDLKQLFLKQENCDVVLRVKGREFSAHKVILMSRSPVFASTFRNDMKEKETGIVDIEDCDPSYFSDFLCFLYCEEMEILSEENIFSLFTAADKHDVADLRTKCLEFMKEHLSVDTFCETITIALKHTPTELIHVSTEFFLENAEEIVETVKWQTFTIENPIQSKELFIKYVKSVKH